MKKFFLGIAMAFLLGGTATAQGVENGDNIINLGFGFDPYYSYGNGYHSSRSNVGPIMVSYERIFTDKVGIGRFGLGGLLTHAFYTNKYQHNNYTDLYKRTRTAALVRCAYHFELPVKGLDLYAGVAAGLAFNRHLDRVTNNNGVIDERTSINVTFAHFVYGGVRYFFNDAIGVYAEFGHGISAVNGGISFRF